MKNGRNTKTKQCSISAKNISQPVWKIGVKIPVTLSHFQYHDVSLSAVCPAYKTNCVIVWTEASIRIVFRLLILLPCRQCCCWMFLYLWVVQCQVQHCRLQWPMQTLIVIWPFMALTLCLITWPPTTNWNLYHWYCSVFTVFVVCYRHFVFCVFNNELYSFFP